MALDDELIDTETIGSIQAQLLTWYQENQRDLPWRNTTDPYYILVSEVMSQQTQLDRVIAPYTEFITRWPTPESLASANQSSIVGFWTTHSLGYNNRAKRLHESAQIIVDEFGGEVPVEPEELQTLPGIGPYTAHAVSSFAFNTSVAVVDTNVKRILYRLFDLANTKGSIPYQAIADALLPTGDARAWNNAIMELGGLVCGKSPDCDVQSCPLRTWCRAYQTGDFTAPDVPHQPSFQGSRRQYRGAIIHLLHEHGEMAEADIHQEVQPLPDTASDGWITDILQDLHDEGLIERIPLEDSVKIRLRR